MCSFVVAHFFPFFLYLYSTKGALKQHSFFFTNIIGVPTLFPIFAYLQNILHTFVTFGRQQAALWLLVIFIVCNIWRHFNENLKNNLHFPHVHYWMVPAVGENFLLDASLATCLIFHLSLSIYYSRWDTLAVQGMQFVSIWDFITEYF